MSTVKTRTVRVRNGIRQSDYVKADESLKMLFHLSPRPIVDLLNGLFGENFNSESASVEPLNTEFVTGELDTIFADSRIRITQGSQTKEFHIEFQTRNDAAMIVRMFEYGFQAAKGRTERVENQVVIRFPPQLVIYLESGPASTEDISCIVQFPPYEAGNQYAYRVPVKRFWEFTAQDFMGQMFALIPFQVFTFRKVISDLVKDRDLSAGHRKTLIHQELEKLKDCIERSHEYILEVHRQQKITDEDVNKMSTVIFNLSRHLYNKFDTYYESFFMEVEQMVKSIFDMKLLRQAREEAKREGRLEGQLEGRIEGKLEGKLEGEIRGKHEMLLSQFSQRNFLDDRIKAFILDASDEAQIQKLSSLILTAKSKQEILQQIDVE